MFNMNSQNIQIIIRLGVRLLPNKFNNQIFRTINHNHIPKLEAQRNNSINHINLGSIIENFLFNKLFNNKFNNL